MNSRTWCKDNGCACLMLSLVDDPHGTLSMKLSLITAVQNIVKYGWMPKKHNGDTA